MGTEVMVRGDVHVYAAVAGTAKPSVTADPPGAWTKIGESYWDPDGITVTGNQTIEEEDINNSTYGQEAFRTDEELIVSGSLKNFSFEALRLAMNNNTVSETAPTATADGFRSLSMKRGIAVEKMAILVRGNSPYDEDRDGWDLQVWCPRVYESGNFTTGLGRGAAAMVPLEFRALEHATLGVCEVDAKDADATG